MQTGIFERQYDAGGALCLHRDCKSAKKSYKKKSAEMFFTIIFNLQEGLSWQLIDVLFLFFFANKGCNPSTSVGMRISYN